MTEFATGFDPSLIDVKTETKEDSTEIQPRRLTLLERYQSDLEKLKTALFIIMDGLKFQTEAGGDTTLLQQKIAQLKEQIRKDEVIIRKLSKKKD